MTSNDHNLWSTITTDVLFANPLKFWGSCLVIPNVIITQVKKLEDLDIIILECH